jgi:hypothetical protein
LRYTDQGVVQEDLELIPIVFQKREFETDGDAVHSPWLGLGLETAHDQPADLFLEIDVPVRVA